MFVQSEDFVLDKVLTRKNLDVKKLSNKKYKSIK